MSQRPKKTKQPAGGLSRPSTSSQQNVSDEEMDYEDMTQTQGSSTLAQKNYDRMDQKLQEKKVTEVVRYLLCAQGRMVPVKPKELKDKVMGPYSRALPVVLEQANLKLQEVFGLEVREVTKGKTKSIILINKLPPSLTSEFLKWSKLDKAHLGLLSVILSLIMMKQGKISDDHLWSYLARLGIARDGKRHSTFGDVERLINKDFVDSMYLEREKQVVGDTTIFTYRWGARAREEVDRTNLMKFVAEIYGANLAVWQRQLGGESSSSRQATQA